MARSYAEIQTLECPACGQTFPAEVWFIVDTAEQPALVERIHQGTIHTLTCPRCNLQADVAAPLLVHDAERQRLFFAPPPGSNEVANLQMATQLVGLLTAAFSKPLPAYLQQVRDVPARLLSIAPNTEGPEELELGDVPEEIATIMRELLEVPEEVAPIMRELLRPAHAADMPQHIELCHQALALVERGQTPVLWAELQASLADSLVRTPEGDRADNCERAFHHYSEALEVYTRQAFARGWARTQDSLGNAYTDRIRGERAENLERAIKHYRKALKVRTRQASPAEWATTQTNLGNAYASRIRGDPAENLERAIKHHRQALKVSTRQAFPAEWAMTQNNLGNAYADRIRGDAADNLEQAIKHYRKALKVRTKETDPERWAMTQNNLAGAYADRIRGDRADNLERAIKHYKLALEVYKRRADPGRWAMAQNNLGDAYRNRTRGDRADNRKQAIKHFTLALDVQTLEQFPADRLQTMRNLGNVYFDMQNWQEADRAFERAIEAGDLLFGVSYTEASRREEVRQTAQLHARAAYALLKLRRFPEALLKLEQGKTRLLSEALALADAGLALLPQTQQRKLRELRQSVRQIEDQMRLSPSTSARRADLELADLLRQARTDLGDLIEAVRRDHPDFMPAGLDLPGILALSPEGGALVAPLVTSQGSAAFVLPEGTRSVGAGHVIPLEGFTEADLHEMLLGPAEDGQLPGWMRAYIALQDSETQGSFEVWSAVIEAATHRLWEALMAPVHGRLQELGLAQGAPVILMPQGGLGLLPLHAAWREVNGAKRAFLDDYTVTYAPSAYALSVAQRRLGEPQRHGASLLAVVNPTGDLQHTRDEGVAVAGHFEPGAQSVLVGGKATQEAVIAQARGRCYLHFSCHGFYHWQDPMASGLLLAGSDPAAPPDPFELREILSPRFDLSAARLVALSACETGLTEFQESPDEYIGLPYGFLQAGTPAVVSSLWAVNDLSTSLLMGEFYRRHLEKKQEPAEALRGAQLWLRDATAAEMKLSERHQLLSAASGRDASAVGWLHRYQAKPGARPFAHPYYWAGFVFSGV